MTERLYLRLEGDPLYAPETTVPAGAMREFAVGKALEPFVASIVTYRENCGVAGVVERVLPDGAVRLIFDLTGVPAIGACDPQARVAGATAMPVVLGMCGRIEGISVTLRPGAARLLLGIPSGEIVERTVALKDLWRAEAGALLSRLLECRGDAARVTMLQQALLGRLRSSTRDRTAEAAAARAAHLIAISGGARRLREVAAAIGVGERRLQQLFHAHVGLTPRAWSRLARLHACLRALRANASPQWAHVAVDGGFYDQSHLVNEFRALCGLTPATFLERVRN